MKFGVVNPLPVYQARLVMPFAYVDSDDQLIRLDLG